jgi:hypothetical protein
MLFLLSGEGASDIGATIRGNDGEEVFDPGPLALIIDSMVEQHLNFSPLSLGYVRHFPRPKLAAMAKSMTPRPAVVIPGAKRPAGNAGDYRQAFALATLAKNIESQEQDAVVAVLFKDSDGTRSDDAKRWDYLVQAIEAAFHAAGYARGVAMIAKPKQEAWFMCALKRDPYQNCFNLEDESGNDNSPSSLKDKVEEALGRVGDKAALVDWIQTGGFDHGRIDMPSFNRFRGALFASF